MIRHPGGLKQTKEWLALSKLAPPARVMDLGAGDGETLALLFELGYLGVGVDQNPGKGVEKGNLLHTGYSDGSFDMVISECTLFLTGDREGGIKEAARLLRQGGSFLYGDVWFGPEEEIHSLLRKMGFGEIHLKDITREWQTYYVQSILDGTFVAPACPIPKGKCRYYLITCKKIYEKNSN